MIQDAKGDRLSHISTRWALVDAAHRGPEDAAGPARSELVRRYGGAVYRYLLGALRDPDAAEELFQEFALRFVRGDFRRADPARGRFRHLIKASLSHMIVDHRKRERRRPLPLIAEAPEAAGGGRDFDRDWRDELLARAWEALAQEQGWTGRPHYTALRLRADRPELSSDDLARRLGAELGRPLTAACVRQLIHRARERFARALLVEVARSLGEPGAVPRAQIEAELCELRLQAYCLPLLGRRGGSG